ncbi:MAG TPA: hypothetical protein VJ725_26060 [Thermoanaerobaculia bacterium]|nr:hypothetical protein [Thermoanaerobaculia bacterium]
MKPTTLRFAAAAALALTLAGCDSELYRKLTTAPPETSAPKDAVALIRHNKQRCLAIAQGATNYFGLSADPSSWNEYIYNQRKDVISELAVQAILEQDVMPDMRSVAVGDEEEAIESLFAAHQQLCASAIQAPSDLGQYDAAIAGAVYGYDAADQVVEGLINVSLAEQQAVVDRYRPQIDEMIASEQRSYEKALGWKSGKKSGATAELERKAYEAQQKEDEEREKRRQEILAEWRKERESTRKDDPVTSKPLGQRETTADRMRAWHASYLQKAAPTKEALGRYLALRDKLDPNVEPACRELLQASETALADPSIFSSPNRGLNFSLKEAFIEFRAAAKACIDVRPVDAGYRVSAGQQALGRAAQVLRGYSLAP